MELDRHALMAARMPEAGGDRALVVAPLVNLDPCSLPAERAPAVGGDHERGLDRGPIGAIEPRFAPSKATRATLAGTIVRSLICARA